MIPLIAVPVAIIGTFAVMAAIGFSLNNLTLFGLVLAIGIVVDDAIVVVEAVEHHIEEGMSPHDATVCAMEQGPGRWWPSAWYCRPSSCRVRSSAASRDNSFESSLTIAVSTLISMFVSLTLSPGSQPCCSSRRKGHYEALPRLAFVLILGFLAYMLAVGPDAAGVARWWAGLAPNNAYLPMAFPWVAAAPGGIVGHSCAAP